MIYINHNSVMDKTNMMDYMYMHTFIIVFCDALYYLNELYL